MRALVTRLRQDGRREKVLVHDWPDPGPPGPAQIRTRTLWSGVTNGTERNDLLGGNYATDASRLPATNGYQNVGEVIAVGRQVTRLAVGDRLFLSQNHIEHCVVPEDDLLIPLPEGLDPRLAALFGMAGVAARTCRTAAPGPGAPGAPGARLLVVGAGNIGQILAQLATLAGMRVTLCDVDPARLALAGTIGAAERCLDVSGDRWQELIPDGEHEVVVDLAGVEGMEDRLIRAAARFGKVVFVAGRRRVDYDFNLGQKRRITLVQSSHFLQEDLDWVCRLTVRGSLRLDPLLRDVVPVAEAARIYERLAAAPGELMGTVFHWGEP